MALLDRFKRRHTGDRMLEATQHRRQREEAAAQVRGKHYVDWVETLNRWRSEGHDDASLELLLEIIAAAERHARVVGREPAPGYTHRAAVIFRRRGDYAAEVAIIDRWFAACPPERRPPPTDQSKLATRLIKARELLAREHGQR